jgi:hypothetical protein
MRLSLVNKPRFNGDKQGRYYREAYQRAYHHAKRDKGAEFGEYSELGKGEYAETGSHGYGVNKNGFTAAYEGSPQKIVPLGMFYFVFTLKGFDKMDRIINADTNREAGD